MLGRKAFTLIELLVVIAVIAILAAILFPVFAKAREKARTTSCTSNVKQMMLAVRSYATDYDSKLPPGAYPYVTPADTGPIFNSTNFTWLDLIHTYMKSAQICICPSKSQSTICSYGWNFQNFGNTPATPGPGWVTKLSKVSCAADTILIGDAEDFEARSQANNASLYSQIPSNQYNGTGLRAKRHNDGGVYGYADGHAKWHSWGSMFGNGEGKYTVDCND